MAVSWALSSPPREGSVTWRRRGVGLTAGPAGHTSRRSSDRASRLAAVIRTRSGHAPLIPPPALSGPADEQDLGPRPLHGSERRPLDHANGTETAGSLVLDAEAPLSRRWPELQPRLSPALSSEPRFAAEAAALAVYGACAQQKSSTLPAYYVRWRNACSSPRGAAAHRVEAYGLICTVSGSSYFCAVPGTQ